MPGTGHSHRYKGSISNRNTKPAFQVLAPWNSKKNGEKNQVAVSTGGDNLNFKLMGAKMMSNYNDASNAWVLDCSLVVQGNKIVDGTVTIVGDVDICGNVIIHGDLSGNDASFNNVDICGNLTIKGHTVGRTAYFTDLSAGTIYDVSDNILTLGNHIASNNQDMRGIFASYRHTDSATDKFGFFGLDPSFNGGLVPDSHGQFLFQTDASFNNSNVPNIFNGQPGRACFGTLDISGSTLYGNGGSGSGAPTINVTGQAGSSMHLVGRTIIAQNYGATAQLDISGGLNVEGLLTADQAITQTGSGQVTFGGNVNANAGLDVTGAALTIDNQAITQTTGGQVTFAGNVDANTGLDVAGAALTITNQAITQTTGGQVTFAGNVDANTGLDVAGAALTITNQAITQTTGGQVTFAGNVDANSGLDVAGELSIEVAAGAAALGLTMQGSSSIPFTAGDFGDVTYDGLCGRIDLSGSVTTGQTEVMALNNHKILASSIILLTLDTTSGNAASCNVTAAVSVGLVNVTFSCFGGPGTALLNGTTAAKLHFLIINPST